MIPPINRPAIQVLNPTQIEITKLTVAKLIPISNHAPTITLPTNHPNPPTIAPIRPPTIAPKA